MKKMIFGALAALFLSLSAFSAQAQDLPKREFRGAWLHIVGNQKIKTMTTKEAKLWITSTLDTLQKAGCNAVLFQVRPQADAFYQSDIEPWTRFLTGEQGVAPKPYWDPLEFAIKEAHARGMELHAWLNPYRVTSNDKEELCPDHLYFKHPERFLKYGKQLYFDPGVPENIAYTVDVLRDIVKRYDVDAVHFDDYFYPYPIAGQDFPDTASFAKYAPAQGFTDLGDWRRNNVTELIRQINIAVKEVKPWIRFGISPFGIHRNKAQDPAGSDTNGLCCYDQLYADIPLWCQKGYIDYNVPQLYWKIGHHLADFETLIHWWNDGNFGGQLYIGESISSLSAPDLNDTTNIQLGAKMKLVRELPNVHGNVWWPGWSLSNDPRCHYVTDSLTVKYQKDLALIPAYTNIDSVAPDPVASIKSTARKIKWTVNPTADPLQEPAFYIVYRFPLGTAIDIEDSSKIVAITRETVYKPAVRDNSIYVVTVTDHCWNESAPSEPVLH